HSIGIYDGYAYINGSRLSTAITGMRILTLANPARPADVGAYTVRYVHDGFVRGDTRYFCSIGQGLIIADLTDKAHVTEMSLRNYTPPMSYTHNAWTSRAGTILYTTDETAAGKLRVWDVVDPRSPIQGGQWSLTPLASVHNVVVQGDSAYVSYYTE